MSIPFDASVNNKFFRNTVRGGASPCIMRNSSTGYTLPNCVGFVWGAVATVGGVKLPWSCNAEDWYAQAQAHGYTVTRKEPQKGCISVWRKGKLWNGGDGAGHVVFVYDYDDKYVYYWQSNYSDSSASITEKKMLRSLMKISGQAWLGYIYVPGLPEKLAAMMNPDIPYSWKMGGGYIWIGQKTTANTIESGKAVQVRLKMLGYYSDNIDGIYGPKTQTAVMKFQKDTDLEKDGICGPITFRKLVAVYGK